MRVLVNHAFPFFFLLVDLLFEVVCGMTRLIVIPING
jgi:hypothetical protein